MALVKEETKKISGKKTERPEASHMDSQLIFNKGVKATQWRNLVSKNDVPHAKKLF